MPRSWHGLERPNRPAHHFFFHRRDRAGRVDERRKSDDRHDSDDHGRHWITEPSLKIGRYMATTRPPMTTPRNRMTIGSMSAIMLLTV